MPWAKTPADRRRDSAIYGAQWKAIRKQALDRDRWKCVLCGSTRKLTVDHSTPVSQGGTHQLTNLRTLCGDCHAKKTATEGGGYRTSTSTADPASKPSTIWLCSGTA